MKKILTGIIFLLFLMQTNALSFYDEKGNLIDGICIEPETCDSQYFTIIPGYCSNANEMLCLNSKEAVEITQLIPKKEEFNLEDKIQFKIKSTLKGKGFFTWALFAKGKGKIKILASQVDREIPENGYEEFFTQRIPIKEIYDVTGENPKIYAAYLLSAKFKDQEKIKEQSIWVKTKIIKIKINAQEKTETEINEKVVEKAKPIIEERKGEIKEEITTTSFKSLEPKSKETLKENLRECNDGFLFNPKKDKECIYYFKPETSLKEGLHNAQLVIGSGGITSIVPLIKGNKIVFSANQEKLMLSIELKEENLGSCIPEKQTLFGGVFLDEKLIEGTIFKITIDCSAAKPLEVKIVSKEKEPLPEIEKSIYDKLREKNIKAVFEREEIEGTRETGETKKTLFVFNYEPTTQCEQPKVKFKIPEEKTIESKLLEKEAIELGTSKEFNDIILEVETIGLPNPEIAGSCITTKEEEERIAELLSTLIEKIFSLKGKKIVLDPGHGAENTGTTQEVMFFGGEKARSIVFNNKTITNEEDKKKLIDYVFDYLSTIGKLPTQIIGQEKSWNKETLQKTFEEGRFIFSRIITESEINLLIAKALKKELEARGAIVELTRTTNESLDKDLSKDFDLRVEKAKNFKDTKEEADFFISIHVNSLENKNECLNLKPEEKGPSALIKCKSFEAKEPEQTGTLPLSKDCTTFDSEEKILAEELLSILNKEFNKKQSTIIFTPINTGILSRLKGTKIKGLILELGFICNTQDLIKLLLYQSEIAEKISLGIEAYEKKVA